MADNNPTLTATLARQAAGIFSFEFSQTFEVGGLAVEGLVAQADESDKLEVAGRDKIRSQNVAVLSSAIANAKYKVGDRVVLNGDKSWQILRFFFSADNAVTTFVLMDAD